jgi:hypothetical protein
MERHTNATTTWRHNEEQWLKAWMWCIAPFQGGAWRVWLAELGRDDSFRLH